MGSKATGLYKTWGIYGLASAINERYFIAAKGVVWNQRLQFYLSNRDCLPMQYTVIRVRFSLFSRSEYLLRPIRPEAAGQINEILSCPSAVNNTQGGRIPYFIRPSTQQSGEFSILGFSWG
ncbi:hypothetical protein CDAR_572141 [Caerostris darwini]|uniref:Uncharacterized protein n=1 Tax=Caerostris darwini TaxID=1538125 RepID=A0AAV4RB56_9ARAC|nr:hypothetical protein CDAR_572141 [Caerostris darwini]